MCAQLRRVVDGARGFRLFDFFFLLHHTGACDRFEPLRITPYDDHPPGGATACIHILSLRRSERLSKTKDPKNTFYQTTHNISKMAKKAGGAKKTATKKVAKKGAKKGGKKGGAKKTKKAAAKKTAKK